MASRRRKKATRSNSGSRAKKIGSKRTAKVGYVPSQMGAWPAGLSLAHLIVPTDCPIFEAIDIQLRKGIDFHKLGPTDAAQMVALLLRDSVNATLGVEASAEELIFALPSAVLACWVWSWTLDIHTTKIAFRDTI